MDIKKILNFRKNTPKKKIFILGTGRSGTHLLARTLGSSSKVDANIENSDFFKQLTYSAINKNKKSDKDIINLLIRYNNFLDDSKSNIILDKTHPNLWLVDYIDKVIDNPFYIGIYRNVYATVNSMLNHKGVLKWYDELDLSKPNEFLGITEQNINEFSSLPLECKCALRWKSHIDELKRLNNSHNNFLLIRYEEFYDDLTLLQSKLNSFLKEDLFFKVEKLNKGGDVKWKKHLTDKQILNINMILKYSND